MTHKIKEIEAPLIEIFQTLDIPFDVTRHEPLFTVEESQSLRGQLPGRHAKSLFLKDKQGNLALCVVGENKRVDLKSLNSKIGLGRISFSSPDLMQKVLGITPGSVTPFALLNLRANIFQDFKKPILVLDKALLEITPIHFHPLHNEATIAITPAHLLKFIHHCGFQPLFLKF